ncbi:50S ribosomal protein L22 [Candidatus Sumerlaeota bacterium]|nr:50S ribosomal protein L22 [Candidatus Sumerlaeota bacterium]MBI3735136.1 50S ribosomal protein L22 [Candidatus Sumerlaeota bacterium]
MRYYGVGQRKVRYVADLIRGLSVDAAQGQLMAMHRPSGAPIVTRLIKSALSNANQSGDKQWDPAELVIGKINVDGGPIQYRFQPMSMGKAGKIRKRTCHITLELWTEA